MIINCEGIVLKQVKTSNGSRIIQLFTKNLGKISVGSNISESGKNKTNLAIKPFTFGNYQIYKNKNYYMLNSADVIKSYYKLGENIEKYMLSSYALELTEKTLLEDEPNPRLFNTLVEFLSLMEERNSLFETLLLGYEVKILSYMGTMPNMSECVVCGAKENLNGFAVEQGGLICEKCKKKFMDLMEEHNDRLIYDVNFGIVDIMKYFKDKPLRALEKIALPEDISEKLQMFLKKYMTFHLDIKNLKSEDFLTMK